MICLTRLNGSSFWLNAELIETLEATPDVVVALTNGRRYVVRESVEQIVDAVLAYRSRVRRLEKEEESGEQH